MINSVYKLGMWHLRLNGRVDLSSGIYVGNNKLQYNNFLKKKSWTSNQQCYQTISSILLNQSIQLLFFLNKTLPFYQVKYSLIPELC